jgi:hypothetical protein
VHKSRLELRFFDVLRSETGSKSSASALRLRLERLRKDTGIA